MHYLAELCSWKFWVKVPCPFLLWFHTISHPLMYIFAQMFSSWNDLARWRRSTSFYPLFVGILWDWGPLLWRPPLELCPGREMQGARFPLTWCRARGGFGCVTPTPLTNNRCRLQADRMRGRSPLAARPAGAVPSAAQTEYSVLLWEDHDVRKLKITCYVKLDETL
jgi:hypothetical protein